MMEFIQNFHFMRPWFLLFLLLPIAILFKKIKTDRASSWEEVCDKHLLNFLIVSEDGLKKINFKKFIYIALVFASISAAGPSWKKIEVQSFSVENPNMFVLSLAQDMQLTDVSPSRLDRAKYIISDIADNISFQGQYGIIVYSDEPYLISPIADDINIIKSYLYQIVPDIVPDNGDRLDRAISLAIERFKSAGYSKGNIILLCSDVGQRLDLAIEKTKEAASLGYNINVIDVSYDGNDKLRLLADTGKGVYLRVFYSSINPIIDMMKKIDNKNVQQDKNLRTIYLDFGYYLVFIPLVCLLLFFRKGILVLLFCFVSFNANAAFLLNKNQEGFILFKQKLYDKAKDVFEDENWQGLSYYMLEKHEDAFSKFDKVKTSDGFYNKGVTLVKLCKYEDAIKAFEESVKLDSKNEDAKYNVTVLNKLFADAKENPKLLECSNEEQQQQNPNDDNCEDPNNKNNNSKNKDTSNNNNPNTDDSDENSQNSDGYNDNKNGEQNSDKENDQQSNNKNNNSDKMNDKNSDKKESDNKNEDKTNQSDNKNNNSESNKSKQSNASDKNNNNSNNDKNSQNNDDSNNKNEEQDTDKNNKQQSNNQNSSSNNETNNNKSDEIKNNNSGKNSSKDNEQSISDNNIAGSNDNNYPESDKETNQRPQLAQFQEGDENDIYDEEAMALQRIYREIPEDIGGLLREFIKKEYMKGRYNENL